MMRGPPTFYALFSLPMIINIIVTIVISVKWLQAIKQCVRREKIQKNLLYVLCFHRLNIKCNKDGCLYITNPILRIRQYADINKVLEEYFSRSQIGSGSGYVLKIAF